MLAWAPPTPLPLTKKIEELGGYSHELTYCIFFITAVVPFIIFNTCICVFKHYYDQHFPSEYFSCCEGRAVYGGYFPVSNMISFVVVDPHQNRSLNPTNIKRFYHEVCQALSVESSISQSVISYKASWRTCIRKFAVYF